MLKFKNENNVFCFFITLPIDWMRISIEDTGSRVVGEVEDAYFPHIYIFICAFNISYMDRTCLGTICPRGLITPHILLICKQVWN